MYGTYYLCNCYELDINHNHTVDFNSLESQINWFMKRHVIKIDETQFHRKDNSITVPRHIDKLKFLNYVLTKNSEDGKVYFYFIYDKIYVSENATKLILKLDVIQTYLFDIRWGEFQSNIERMHTKRYDSNGNILKNDLIIPENLEIGEYIEVNRTTIYDYNASGGYIVASSEKLSAKNGGSTSGGSNGSNFNEGIPSAKLFRFLKGYEAFGEYPYRDSGGVLTYGYGVTGAEQDKYNSMLPPPVSEEKASEVLADIIINNYAYSVYNQMKKDNVDFTKIKQQHFDAFVSLCYNGGLGAVTKSPMYTKFKLNPYDDSIYNDWLTWYIKDNAGNTLQGLKNRRKAEAKIYQNNDFEMKQILKINSSGNYEGYVEGDGFIPDIFKETENEIGVKLVNSARKLIGKPYVWGGNYPPLGNDNGTDCSGLMQWAFNDNGLKITRTTYTQIKEGKEVSQSNVQLGDLIFSNFSSPGVPEHVYMYSGIVDDNHMCIEAPRTGLNIRERKFEFTSDMRIRRLI